LNPGWVHRRKNTCPEVRYATHRLLKTDKQTKPNSTVCHARAIKNQQTKTPSTLYHAQTIKNWQTNTNSEIQHTPQRPTNLNQVTHKLLPTSPHK